MSWSEKNEGVVGRVASCGMCAVSKLGHLLSAYCLLLWITHSDILRKSRIPGFHGKLLTFQIGNVVQDIFSHLLWADRADANCGVLDVASGAGTWADKTFLEGSHIWLQWQYLLGRIERISKNFRIPCR